MTCMSNEEVILGAFKQLIQLCNHKTRLWILKELTKYIKVTLVKFDKGIEF